MAHDPVLGILFDKDGTLVDYEATWAPINVEAATFAAGGDAILARRLLKIGGHDPETNRIAGGSLLAAGHTVEIATAWHEAGACHSVPALVRELDRIFTAGADRAVCVPGVISLFATLRAAGIRIGVATSDSLAGAKATLAAIGADELTDFVAGYDSGYGGKPEPGMALKFAASCDLPCSNLLMAGDNLHDIRMGRAAGYSICLGVLTGTGSRSELSDEADHVLDDVTRIPDLLKDIGRWPSPETR